MEPHLQKRPKKTPYAVSEQHRLRDIAIQKIKAFFSPYDGILKMILMGSSVKGTFGSYAEPGFRGSLFSDFDFILFVKETYVIPPQLEREPNGKPFEDARLNLAYRKKNFVEGMYDAEIFFIREQSLQEPHVRSFAESAGIPLDEKSKNPENGARG